MEPKLTISHQANLGNNLRAAIVARDRAAQAVARDAILEEYPDAANCDDFANMQRIRRCCVHNFGGKELAADCRIPYRGLKRYYHCCAHKPFADK